MTFAIARPRTVEQASRYLTDDRFSLPVLKGGGMDIVDHLKEGLADPDLLIDVRRVNRNDRALIRTEQNRITIDAGATMAEVAASADVQRSAPVIAQALADAATPQVRNVATAAGNLLQRPRCWYYRNDQFDCLKKGGRTCYAIEGENKYHAIFGMGPCYIVHPSNLAPALYVTDGRITIYTAADGERDIPVTDLYHGPTEDVRSEYQLPRGAVITRITAAARPTSGFYAVKEKQSFDWPLVFACVALELDGRTIRSASVCAGAVAPVPHPLPHIADALRGVRVDDDAALTRACADAARGARPMRDNEYKTRLLPVAVRRAVMRAAGRPIPGEEA